MVKVNMMCGKRDFGPDWVSVDMATFPHITERDITLNKWPDESADLIYCSHGIAYFDRKEIVPILNAWHRVLKPGGALRIATTDIYACMRLYPETACLQEILGPLYGRMEVDGKVVYHKTVYDFTDLVNLLGPVGFCQFRKYDHRETEHPNTGNREDKYDDHSAAYIKGKLISLNIECQKKA